MEAEASKVVAAVSFAAWQQLGVVTSAPELSALRRGRQGDPTQRRPALLCFQAHPEVLPSSQTSGRRSTSTLVPWQATLPHTPAAQGLSVAALESPLPCSQSPKWPGIP